MLQRNSTATLVQWTLSLCLIAGAAQAQANPELGEVGGTAQAGGSTQTGTTGAARGTWQPPTSDQTTTATDTTAAPAAEVPAGDTDHAGVSGTFGVGFFGVVGVPAMGCGGGAGGCPDIGNLASGNPFEVQAPTLGVRYWLQDDLAIEAAIGFNISSSGTTTTVPAGAPTDANGPSYVAFALHGGLPLAFASSKHFTFEVIPELNFGFASGSLDTGNTATSIDLSGMLFELGGRIGGEIQFGFIDIPQLALQATVGAHLRYEGRSATANSAAGATEISSSSFRFGTTMQGEPWDIFTGNIAAIYYF